VAKERVSPPTYCSVMDGSFERVATTTFVPNSYQFLAMNVNIVLTDR